jgi:transcription elongation factor Elf1
MATIPWFFTCRFCGGTKCVAPPLDAPRDYMVKCMSCGREAEALATVKARAWEIARQNVFRKMLSKLN